MPKILMLFILFVVISAHASIGNFFAGKHAGEGRAIGLRLNISPNAWKKDPYKNGELIVVKATLNLGGQPTPTDNEARVLFELIDDRTQKVIESNLLPLNKYQTSVVTAFALYNPGNQTALYRVRATAQPVDGDLKVQEESYSLLVSPNE